MSSYASLCGSASGSGNTDESARQNQSSAVFGVLQPSQRANINASLHQQVASSFQINRTGTDAAPTLSTAFLEKGEARCAYSFLSSQEQQQQQQQQRQQDLYQQQLHYFAALQAQHQRRFQEQQHEFNEQALQQQQQGAFDWTSSTPFSVPNSEATAAVAVSPHYTASRFPLSPLYNEIDASKLVPAPSLAQRGHSFSGVTGEPPWEFASLMVEGTTFMERSNSMPNSNSRRMAAAAAAAATGPQKASQDSMGGPSIVASRAGSKGARTRSSLPFAPTLKTEDGLFDSKDSSAMSASSFAEDDFDESYDSGHGDASADTLGAPVAYDGSDPEVFKCPHCDKQYTGKHARSIWRRHLQDKHSIPLSLQPRRTRWDGDANRPKNAEERRARMLESKRRWARKKRMQDKAVSLGLPPDADVNTIRKRMAEMPAHEFDQMMDEPEGGMPSVTQPTFSVGSRIFGTSAAVASPSTNGAGASGNKSSAQLDSRPIASVQQQADDSFFRHASGAAPDSSARSDFNASPGLVADRIAGVGTGRPQKNHQPDVFDLPPAQGPVSFTIRHLDPNVTPIQHFAMLQPTPPSTGPSSAEKDLHALKHKMLASMYGSKYKPLLSPPTSGEKSTHLSQQQQQPPTSVYPKPGILNMATPSFAATASSARSSDVNPFSQQVNQNNIEPPHSKARAGKTEEAAEEAASQLLALASESTSANERAHAERQNSNNAQGDSPTRSPSARPRKEAQYRLGRPGMSPRSNSVSAPSRPASGESTFGGSPRRHSSLEPLVPLSHQEPTAGQQLATTTVAAPLSASRFTFDRASSPRANPFSLEQHKISPILSRRTSGLSPSGANQDLPLAGLLPLRMPLLGVDLKLPPLVATPAREFADPIGSMKRSPIEEEERANSVTSDASKKPRLDPKDINISPVRPGASVAEGHSRSFFTPFHKSTSQATTDALGKSVVRPSLGILGSASRPSRRDDQFSSPQHLGLTSSLGLAPQSVLRNANAANFDVDTPAPAASKTAWPATVLRPSSGSQGPRYAASSLREQASSSPVEEDEDPLARVASGTVYTQQRKINNDLTPSKRGQARSAKPPGVLSLGILNGSPKKKVPSAM
ncbi:hypothetical protein K437DRAFT_172700 [Tilletiaria anomala UBC 951]|uniref:Uncharacterized protein n=1 Tax=Tilletiaria anomala (strain ATCC 24038 / CBS 436.72 / UBC 951) TaxID=1037660 RepID=A0A066VSH1_TILAU|nr:uncharacterized protein K437DRAFT_172700 [Tilletiaria anomala UBC 951]KDN41515.1 hypothetical protein K437DRAFT_172700 [Tilletiaria anomala UBC 951]